MADSHCKTAQPRTRPFFRIPPALLIEEEDPSLIGTPHAPKRGDRSSSKASSTAVPNVLRCEQLIYQPSQHSKRQSLMQSRMTTSFIGGVGTASLHTSARMSAPIPDDSTEAQASTSSNRTSPTARSRIPKFMLKEAIVADASFNRWRIPVAAVATHLSIGSVYAWSIFNQPLTTSLGVVAPAPGDWELSSVVPIFSLAIFSLGVSAAVAGMCAAGTFVLSREWCSRA